MNTPSRKLIDAIWASQIQSQPNEYSPEDYKVLVAEIETFPELVFRSTFYSDRNYYILWVWPDAKAWCTHYDKVISSE